MGWTSYGICFYNLAENRKQTVYTAVFTAEGAYEEQDLFHDCWDELLLDIDYDENIHDGLVDARNTALLFRKMQTEEVFHSISITR